MSSIHAAGFYVFRRPLVPVDSIFRLFEQTGTRANLEEQLQVFFREPHLREAIYLASPQLHARLEQWLGGNVVADKQRLFKSLFKYLVRAGTRCTPYGMFAGCVQVGHFARRTRIVFPEENPYIRYSRPDMGCLVHLAEGISRHPQVRRQVKFYPNGSLYEVGDQYRYTFYEIEQNVWNYSVCSVDKTEYIEQAFAAAREGATRRQIAELMTSGEVTVEEAEEYVDQLIAEQLLVSDLQLNLTGPHYFETLLGMLSAMQEVDEVVDNLRTIRQLLQTADNPIEHYRKVQEIVHLHFAKGPPADLVQTDICFRTEVNEIGQPVIDTLTGNLEKLMVLHQGNYNADLDDFRKKFYERYEEEEVPLLAVLDPEIGIGYGARGEQQAGHLPLIESLDVQPQKKGAAIEWNFWKDFVLRKYSEALFGQQNQILLTEEDISLLESHLDPRTSRFRTSFTAFGNLLAGSAAAADGGDFLFNLYAVAGPSAANLLGRFCPLDPELCQHVEACLRQEEQQFPEAVFAEIVHLPEARAGNILARPAFRQYEIPYLAKASVDTDHQIPLTDIMVSLRNGREIVLRSRRLNVPIIPRLATAHNYKKGLSIYKFLCDLQYQDQVPNVFWHWSMLEKQGFLPRVRYRNVIVSRATWNLSLQEYPELHNPQLPVSAFFAQLRTKLRLPRYVSLAESDNELLIDLQNTHCLELLRETFLKKELITLKEYLQFPDQCLLESGAGKYTNEIIIPLYQDKSGAPAGSFPRRSPTKPAISSALSRWAANGCTSRYIRAKKRPMRSCSSPSKPSVRNCGPKDWWTSGFLSGTRTLTRTCACGFTATPKRSFTGPCSRNYTCCSTASWRTGLCINYRLTPTSGNWNGTGTRPWN
jgi:hypothetical protein